ncbi:cleavage stimulation factor subunit 2 isoform X3 [Orcinus orca]|uniref:Cleavage stimulation factor subunit 2 isoform X1 n=2 Tax=Odontoceti TaxID=9722 RepID=A0A6J3QTN4_TURTR|nr:cleavage stimulation factor subunit 2 isoform X1 [Lagenorhynchus obliquidens]XP_029096521.1 cleavage stimulation factor subunit 2 isoform X1 [Monodon monoceros]XP_032476387.1 cleavage stimulation factor subunit 2 isoform X1 [Phocoena sinus]XP_033268304.1 cleavage stimulation factor subunit 2 isoform X3 [Orcinus orca]XP_033705539.1 cleavage stimulation factor subunit 2 isoform X1 [Tursiops truncatus]XP_059993516.1 cleavage stimulation factor subunit 2 isoform X2 [Lagenorhynchus albirostris]
MAGLTVRDPAVDRSLRSVFVGNIPYEATEEQLKDIFSEVGPVVSFRLVYDRETGKPKGYGFCEYQDQETALSAMRNLNGREFSGRALRVDNAASEKNKEELKSLGTGAPVIESPYGETISPEDAPESISKAVASLPPEQMFELMKQMKLCVQNSPQEARNMLLQNPQLAYALLQAQVVMRIVDPEIALKILHRQTNIPTLIAGNPQTVHSAGPGSGSNVSMNQQNPQAPQAQSLSGMHVNGAPPLMQASLQAGVAAPGQIPATVTGPGPGSLAPGAYIVPLRKTELLLRGKDQTRTYGGMQAQVGMPGSGPVSMERGQVPMQDPRAAMQRGPLPANVPTPRGLLGDAPNDPRGGTLLSVTGEVEPRGYLGPPHQGPPMHHVPGHDSRGPPPHEMRGGPLAEPRPLMAEPRGPMLDQRGPPLDGRGGRDPRGIDARGMEARAMEARGLDARGLEARAMEARAMEARAMEARAMEARAMEVRGMEARSMDTRGPVPGPRGPIPSGIQGPSPINMGTVGPQGSRQVPVMQGAGMQGASIQGGGQPGGFSPGQNQVTPQDHEKAALIMQVLQLTADQIAMLPPEQRQSILILKEQIQKSTGAP